MFRSVFKKVLNNAPFSVYDVAKSQLSGLASKSQINFSDYTWADVLGGNTGVWSQCLFELSGNPVTLVDLSPPENLKNKNILIKKLDVKTIKDERISAAFLRSSLSPGILSPLLRNNKNIKLLVFCPVWDSVENIELLINEGLTEFLKVEKIESLSFNKKYVSGPQSEGTRTHLNSLDKDKNQINFYVFKERINNNK